MKTMTKVIAVIMMMTITTTATANTNKDKNTRPMVTVEIGVRPNSGHYGPSWHSSAPAHRSWHQPAPKADIRTCTLHVSQRTVAKRNVVAAANSIHGVKQAKWNPATNRLTVVYDARVTSPQAIMRMIE